MEFLKGDNGLYFLIVLLVFGAGLERLAPWRKDIRFDLKRWARNASMAFYGVIALSLVPFIAGYSGAVAAEENGIGLLNQFALPFWAELALAVIVIDALSYGQHRCLHGWYLLWRTHRVHHSDETMDVATSLRFHPLETLFRATLEAGTILVIGLSPEGILLSFGVLVFFNTITHMNVALPAPIEAVVSRVFVTPSLHRLHHSTAPAHQYSNFGTMLIIWDKIFGTYCPSSELRDDAQFGIEGAEQISPESFANLALDPFRKPANGAIPKEEQDPVTIGKPAFDVDR